MKEGLSIVQSEYSGRGRLDEAKSYFANCTVLDKENGPLLMRMSGLRSSKLDTIFKVDPHVFNKISWKPDISFLTQDQLSYLATDETESKVDFVIDIIGHKKPALRVLEVNLDLILLRFSSSLEIQLAEHRTPSSIMHQLMRGV